MNTKNADRDWNIQEKVVAIIEQYLDQSARVEHDINLPVLGSNSGRTRQCDVVIWQGIEPRQTISIVEVQKRGTKPDINTFGGWLKKKEEVGAQHLICVSEKGFPRSIVEAAEGHGPSVRLMTLRNLENEGWPFPSAMFNTKLDVTEYKSIDALRVEGHHVIKVKEAGKEGSKDPKDGVFKRPNSNSVLSTADVADERIFSNPNTLRSFKADGSSYPIQMDFQWDDWDGLHYQQVGGGWVPIYKLSIRLTMERHKAKIDWIIAEYFQMDWGKGIAWVVKGVGQHKGNQVTIALPVMKLGQARYALGLPHVIGDFDAFVQVHDAVIKARRFDGK